MKHQKTIDDEIKQLSTMKPNVIRQSMFGDNHHDAIDAQIDVLENDLGQDEIYNRLDGGDWQQNVADAATLAREWLDEETDATPSKDWESLIRK